MLSNLSSVILEGTVAFGQELPVLLLLDPAVATLVPSSSGAGICDCYPAVSILFRQVYNNVRLRRGGYVFTSMSSNAPYTQERVQ